MERVTEPTLGHSRHEVPQSRLGSWRSQIPCGEFQHPALTFGPFIVAGGRAGRAGAGGGAGRAAVGRSAGGRRGRRLSLAAGGRTVAPCRSQLAASPTALPGGGGGGRAACAVPVSAAVAARCGPLCVTGRSDEWPSDSERRRVAADVRRALLHPDSRRARVTTQSGEYHAARTPSGRRPSCDARDLWRSGRVRQLSRDRTPAVVSGPSHTSSPEYTWWRSVTERNWIIAADRRGATDGALGTIDRTADATNHETSSRCLHMPSASPYQSKPQCLLNLPRTAKREATTQHASEVFLQGLSLHSGPE